MRRVDLLALDEPPCLKEQRDSGNNWSNLPGSCKRQVRERLGQMQSQLCIYCERILVEGQLHVEHLQSQSGHDTNTLDWGNLSLSCDSIRSCGQHKGSQILPILPQDFPVDHPYSVGVDGLLTAREQAEVWEEIIRVVDLNGELTGDLNLKAQRRAYFDALLEVLLLEPPLKAEQAQALCQDYHQQRGLPTTARSVFETLYRPQD